MKLFKKQLLQFICTWIVAISNVEVLLIVSLFREVLLLVLVNTLVCLVPAGRNRLDQAGAEVCNQK